MRRQHEYIRRLNAEFLSRGRQPFAFVETYGCQQNNSDSERIKGMLADMGFAF
ncbi:MAG: tRNA (N6-isopentenyl adenosine(37)-C2)-methylthiotransferase MiaB, partial [Clostridiales bacterium]|nr:tRNA (N6-isopentenyl adenosine(37)-C2)-methylthiotransferase MiaB [Clostridiales bacterium]